MHYGCFVQKYNRIWQTYFEKEACWLTIKDGKMNIHLYVLNEYKIFKVCIIWNFPPFKLMLINQHESRSGLLLSLAIDIKYSLPESSVNILAPRWILSWARIWLPWFTSLHSTSCQKKSYPACFHLLLAAVCRTRIPLQCMTRVRIKPFTSASYCLLEVVRNWVHLSFLAIFPLLGTKRVIIV